jgi:hypothetical protein
MLNFYPTGRHFQNGRHNTAKNQQRKSGIGKMNGTAITNWLQNSFKIKDNNVYGSSYYWNFRTSSFKQVACLILVLQPFIYSSPSLISSSIQQWISGLIRRWFLLSRLVFYYINASDIWSDKRDCLLWESYFVDNLFFWGTLIIFHILEGRHIVNYCRNSFWWLFETSLEHF